MNTPKDYICPITRELMELPVILIEDGRSYEKNALEKWLQENDRSPMTNKPLKNKSFIINMNLKNAIEDFREKQFKAQHCQMVSSAIVTKTGGLSQELQDSKYTRLRIKVCLFGDPSVGKTTLVRHLRFQDRIEKKEYISTMQPDMVLLHIDRLFEEKYAVSIQVYDLPGELNQNSVWKSQYKCHGAILVCDVTRPKTLKNIKNLWYPALKENGFDLFECVLLCNKIDLAGNSEEQVFKDADIFATRNDLSLFHTSGWTGKNVQTMINQLVLCILSNPDLLNLVKQNANNSTDTDSMQTRNSAASATLGTENITLTPTLEKPKEKKGCC